MGAGYRSDSPLGSRLRCQFFLRHLVCLPCPLSPHNLGLHLAEKEAEVSKDPKVLASLS